MNRQHLSSRFLLCAITFLSAVCFLPTPVPASSLSIFKKSNCCTEQPKCKPECKPVCKEDDKCPEQTPACVVKQETKSQFGCITVHCPENALITINGGKTHQTGNYRRFRSLLPKDGKCRRYDVVATITENKKTYELSDTLTLCADEDKSVDFHKLLADKKKEVAALQALQAVQNQVQVDREKAEKAARDAQIALAAVVDLLKVKFKFQETNLVAYVKYKPLDGSIESFTFERPSTPGSLTVVDETKWAPGGVPNTATLTLSVDVKLKDGKSKNLGKVIETVMGMVTVKTAALNFVDANNIRTDKATFFFDGTNAAGLSQHVVNLVESSISESQQMSSIVISAKITTPQGEEDLKNEIHVKILTRR